ncbi:MAG TPA: alpha/beta hydrolase [Usitatibacteraceae bacterium]
MNYVDVFFTSSDGLRLYARDYPGPAAAAPVVLCLPGLTRNSKDFAALAEDLCKTYRVVCPDQRGRGRSARDPEPARYRPEQYAGDMETLLNLLHIKRVAVIGTSLGGLMAIMMMARDPQRIHAAVLNDVGPELDPCGIARIAAYVGKTAPAADWDEAVQQTSAINGAAFPDFTIEDWQAMARDIYIQEGTRPVLDYDPTISQGIAAGSAAPNLWPLFEMVSLRPLLVLRGESSDILSAATLAEMTRRLPQLTSLTITGRGHAPTLTEPAARAAITKFLHDCR